MQPILNKKIVFLGLLISGFLGASTAKAVCPVCVIAVGAGLGLSRWLGVDDVVSSIWIGGLLWAISAWTVVWLKAKNWSFKFYEIAVPVVYYALVLGPLYFSEIIGHPLNTILGIDKIIFGSIVGTLVFVAATMFHNFLKKKNGGKSYFPYQKVVVPFLALFIISLAFHFILPWM